MIVPLIKQPGIEEHYQVVLTFFSPSGYNFVGDSSAITGKFYLPIDYRRNMQKFVELLNPEVFVFVKYDFWFNLMRVLREQNVHRVLVNGLLRNDQFLMRRPGRFLFKELTHFDHLFVQDENSRRLLSSRGIYQVTVTGDLRLDRVRDIKNQAKDIPELQEFYGPEPVIIAGSSWPAEESVLADFMAKTNQEVKLIIAPHDVSESHIGEIVARFKTFGVSLFKGEKTPDAKVFIINTIGILSSAYRYADIAFVGGAFDKGLHNVMEAVTFGLPVITGPKTEKFPEARLLEEYGILTKVTDNDDFLRCATELVESQDMRNEVSNLCKSWMEKNTGAAEEVGRYFEKINART